MDDAKKNGTEEQKECTTTLPPPSVQQSAEPERIQEAKRLKLTDPNPTQSPSLTDLSSDPLAFLDPIPPPPNSGPVESQLQATAAHLRLLKPKERAEYKLSLVGGRPIRKKRRRVGPGPVWTPPGPSSLGPGPSPHERVKKVVSSLKNYLHLDTPKSPPPPGPSQPVMANAASSEAVNVAPPPAGGSLTLEKVILKLDEYVDGISSSVSDEEMEGLLREFQRSVEADDEDESWYGLIKESKDAFWKSLTEYFICETFFESDLEDVDDEEEEDGEIFNAVTESVLKDE